MEISKFKALSEVTNAINSTLEIEPLLNLILAAVASAMKAEASSIVLKEDKELFFYVATGEKKEDLKKIKLEAGQGIVGWVIEHQEPALVPDVRKDDGFLKDVDQKTGFVTKSIICSPLEIDNEVLGAVEVINSLDKTSFDEEDLRFLRAASRKIALCIKNAFLCETASRKRLEGIWQTMKIKSSIIGKSPQIKKVLNLVDKVAKIDTPVLITGEMGTGKKLVARAIHDNSRRKTYPFIEINCRGVRDDLLEADLFGHEEGAFAKTKFLRKGKFETAHLGTLFLDGAEEMSLSNQEKVLKAISNKGFYRMGGEMLIATDVRIIAASNADLIERAEEGLFSQELYSKLNEVKIDVPPLRDRKEDIPLLINHYLKQFNLELNKNVRFVSQEALGKLKEYPWYGNIRELMDALRHIMILAEGDTIMLSQLPFEIHYTGTGGGTGIISLEEVERAHLIKALEYTNQDKSGAANLLKISRQVLEEKMAMFGFLREQR
ncbi:sigma-54-dependent Fis family transcriptional regulator [bacterium]|nr:sigma-54-dependent Fis family transcriptional regulator [bacterium]